MAAAPSFYKRQQVLYLQKERSFAKVLARAHQIKM